MSETGYAPGLLLPEECPARLHGVRYGLYTIAVSEYDPDCHTCMARKTLRGDHDHLHLSGEECTTLGISGVPGQTVKCKCGGFHH